MAIKQLAIYQLFLFNQYQLNNIKVHNQSDVLTLVDTIDATINDNPLPRVFNLTDNLSLTDYPTQLNFSELVINDILTIRDSNKCNYIYNRPINHILSFGSTTNKNREGFMGQRILFTEDNSGIDQFDYLSFDQIINYAICKTPLSVVVNPGFPS